MADFDSKLPIRSLALDNTTEIADSAGVTINPAKEDGNLASIKTNTDNLDVLLSTRASEVTLAALNAKFNSLGQKTMANSAPVVIASDQSSIPVLFDEGNSDQTDYNTAVGVAASASSTHTFTPAANLRVKTVQASASGQMKIEIRWGVTASETAKMVSFTSKGDLDFEKSFPDGIALAPTDSLLIIRTNADNQAMDVYSSVTYQLD